LRFFKWLSRNRYDSITIVPKLTIPCLFISSGKDELIPAHMMPKLRASYGNQDVVHHLHYPEAQHMNAHLSLGYADGILRFLNAAMRNQKKVN
jgi:pimeloyl-ACP methyl ester carboxylesterase